MDDSVALLPRQGPVFNRLSKFQKACYGVGHVMNDICAAMWFSYTLLFFHIVLAMPPLLAGIMLLIGQVADAVATPIVGIYADRTGSRKTWHLVGSALVVFSFPLIFSPCPGCQDPTPLPVRPGQPIDNSTIGTWTGLKENELWLRGLYYAFLIIIFQAGWAIVQISHLALIPDLTPSQGERAELTAVRYTASVCSSVLMYLVTWLILHVTASGKSAIGPGDSYKFRDIVLIGILVGGLFSAWFHFGLQSPRTYSQIRRFKRELDYDSNEDEITTSTLFRTPELYKVSILYVASRLFLTLSLVYMPLYLAESLGEQAESLATVPLVAYIASFLASLVVKTVSSRASSKVLYLSGGIISILACIWIGFGVGIFDQTAELYLVAILMGSGSSVTMVSSLCFTADLIGSHTENGAFVYSVVTFADKLLNGVAVMGIEGMQCESIKDCPNYYRDVLAFACGSCALFGLLALFTLRRNSLGGKPDPASPFRKNKKTFNTPQLPSSTSSTALDTYQQNLDSQ